MSLPKVIYVQEDRTDESDTGENLLAWRNRKNIDAGRVAMYVKGDELDLRRVEEVKKVGHTRWEKW